MRGLVPAAFIAAIGANACAADTLNLSTKNRIGLFKSQTAVLDSRAAAREAPTIPLEPTYVIPGREPKVSVARFNGSYRGPYLTMARAAARRHNIPEDLFLRLVQQESGWKPNAVSHKGALGLAQLMPATAQKLRVDPRDPAQNLEGGARYLRMQFDRFRNWRLALAAYNAGPGAVERYGGVPPYRETQGYVRAILGG